MKRPSFEVLGVTLVGIYVPSLITKQRDKTQWDRINPTYPSHDVLLYAPTSEYQST